MTLMISNPADRFAIVPLPPGTSPAPDDAIVVGPLSEVTEYIGQSIARADAVAELNRARFTADQIARVQSVTRAVQVATLADTIKQLDARLNTLAQRRADAASARRRRDEEEEQKRIQAELDALPDPDAPDLLLPLQSTPDPMLPLEGDSIPPAHGDPPGDPRGDFKYPVAADVSTSVTFPDPDQPHLPEGTSVPQPISAGLDKKD